MNITTHGKDGPKLNLLTAEKRLLRNAYKLTAEIAKQHSFPKHSSDASVAAAGLDELLATIDGREPIDEGEEAYKEHTAIGGQHREENVEEHEQKITKQGAKV